MAITAPALREESSLTIKSPLNDFVDVGLDFCQEKPYAALKSFYVLSEFGMHLGFVSTDNKALNSACIAAKIGKLSRAPWDFIRNTTKACATAASYLEGKKIVTPRKQVRTATLGDVVRDTNGIVSPTREVWEFMIKTAHIPGSAIFNTFKGISSISLILGMGWSSFDEVCNLHDSDLTELKGKARRAEDYKVGGYLIKLAKNVSYLALGVIGLLTTFFGFGFAPFTTCALSTSTVVFTILEHYHKNLWSEKKLT